MSALRRFGLVAALALVTSSAHGQRLQRPGGFQIQTPPVSIVHLETNAVYADITDPTATVFYATTAPAHLGEPEGWWLRMDVGVRNDGAVPVTIVGFELDTDATAPDFAPLDEPIVIAPGATHIFFPQELQGLGAQPGLIGVRVHVDGYAMPVQRINGLASFDANTPSGGYRFPGRLEDLPAGMFWGPGGADHAHSRSQRYAYDFSVYRQREDGSFTWLTEEAYAEAAADPSVQPGDRNAHYLIFGMPLYAIADGTIVKCVRSEPDLDPEFGTDDPSNKLIIELDSGETVAYAHLQEGSIPAELCPVEWPGVNVPVAVKAGQFVGNAGGSGTEGPHLHIQLQDGPLGTPADDIRGLPLRFHNIDVQDRDAFDPDGWTRVTQSDPVALRGRALVRPNPCGWPVHSGTTEVTYGHIPASCYQLYAETLAGQGLRQMTADGYTVNGRLYFNGVWQPADGTAWASRHNLSSAQLDAELATREAAGFKPTHLDSYVVDGVVRYAAVFSKVPGQFEAFHGLSYAEHQAILDSLTPEGFQPIVVSVVSNDGDREYAVVYQAGVPGSFELRSQVPAADYQALVDKQTDAGRGLRSLQVYWHGGALYFAALFGSQMSAPIYSHGIAYDDVSAVFRAHREAGDTTRLITAYAWGGDVYFAGAWNP